MEPLVSVICITRNHERFCIESLASVLNQTYKNIEWVILDAASTDRTVELIDNWLVENDVNAVFLKERELKSLPINLNKALTFASGEFLQLLSLDDILLPEKIERQISEFNQLDKTFVGIYTDASCVNENNACVSESTIKWNRDFAKIPEGGFNLFEILCEGNFIPMMSLLIRMEPFIKSGGFDERLSHEDYDLHLRLTKRFKYKYLTYKSVIYRVHMNNLHRDAVHFTQLRDEVIIFFKHINTRIGRQRFLLKLRQLLEKNNFEEDMKFIQKHTRIPLFLLKLLRFNNCTVLKIFQKIN